MYYSTFIQLYQSKTPVILHPNNVFTFWHLKMISIFIWPCYMQIPFVLLCHITISQTWYQSGVKHILFHKSFTNQTENMYTDPKKFTFLTFFMFDHVVAQVKTVAALLYQTCIIYTQIGIRIFFATTCGWWHISWLWKPESQKSYSDSNVLSE